MKIPKKSEKKTKQKLRTKNKKRRIVRSTQAFSPIYDVRNGIIVSKDKRFIKVMEFRPINFLLLSFAGQDNVIAFFAMALRSMPVTVQFKILSRRADIENTVGKIREDMQTELDPNCRRMQKEQIEMIRQVGLTRGVSRRFFVIIRYERPQSFTQKSSFDEIAATLERTAATIRNDMERCGCEMITTKDKDEAILSLLYAVLCRKESEEKSFDDRMVETVSRYLCDDAYDVNTAPYIPVNDMICPKTMNSKASPRYLIVDGLYHAYAYLPSKCYPTRVTAGWISSLINMGEGVDVDIFVEKQPIESVKQKLMRNMRWNKVKLHGTEDTSMDYDDLSSVINAGYYLKQGLANNEDFCYMGILITIIGDTNEDLELRLASIKEFLIKIDLKLKLCLFRQEEAFQMALPICAPNKSIFHQARRNILTSSLASVFPFVSYEMNDENGIVMGVNKNNNSIVKIDSYDTSKYENANMILLGTTGAGKTFALQTMAMRMREKKAQVFIIAPDKGHEFRRAAEAIGGMYIKICPGSVQCINIMEIRKQDKTTSELLDGLDLDSVLANKIQQLHVFFSLLIPDMSHEEKQLLDEALIHTYEKFGISNDNASLFDAENPTQYRAMPILGDVYEELENGGAPTQHMKNILNRYVHGSAKTFNQQTNVDLDNQYIVLDVSDLTEDMLPMGMFVVFEYVFDKVREDRTRRKAIFLDELWALIGEKATTASAAFVVRAFRIIRAYGGAAIAATQGINEFFSLEDGKYGKTILNMAKTKILMKMEQEEATRVGDILNLTTAERQQLTRFHRGEALISTNANHVLVDIQASPLEAELITTDPKELKAIAHRKKQEQAAAKQAQIELANTQ